MIPKPATKVFLGIHVPALFCTRNDHVYKSSLPGWWWWRWISFLLFSPNEPSIKVTFSLSYEYEYNMTEIRLIIIKAAMAQREWQNRDFVPLNNLFTDHYSTSHSGSVDQKKCFSLYSVTWVCLRSQQLINHLEKVTRNTALLFQHQTNVVWSVESQTWFSGNILKHVCWKNWQ